MQMGTVVGRSNEHQITHETLIKQAITTIELFVAWTLGKARHRHQLTWLQLLIETACCNLIVFDWNFSKSTKNKKHEGDPKHVESTTSDLDLGDF